MVQIVVLRMRLTPCIKQRGGEGRCLLLFRLKEMFWKLKVISSQAFVTELHSCQVAFDHMQQPWVRSCRVRSSTARGVSQPWLSSLHPEALSRHKVPDLPPSQKLQDELGSASRVSRLEGNFQTENTDFSQCQPPTSQKILFFWREM